VDTLVSTQNDLLLGNWVKQARDFGSTDAEKNFYEKDARVLITTWGGEANVNTDYAAKDWSGLISTYYKGRWQLFFNFLEKTIKDGSVPDMKSFDKQRTTFEWQWDSKNQSVQTFTSKPAGNTFKICEELYKKWVLFL
jgi:alpha-N-acetylglucosaminidase